MDNLITLYYVDGISKNDTPYFAALGLQQIYFSQHIVKVISSSYYPPFFTDTIKFENDDLDVNTHVNYLSVYYNDRYYYYFISAIRYSSRGIIECDIEMDTIQTFYFNFSIKNSIIERKFIDRWNGNSINRNYIRENVTEGNFKLYTFTKYTKDNMSDWFLISKFSQYDKTATFKSWSTIALISENLSTEISSSDIKLSSFMPCATTNISGGSSTTYISGVDMIKGAYISEYLDNYLCPFPPIKGLSIEIVPGLYTLKLGKELSSACVAKLNFDDMQGETIDYLDISKCTPQINVYTKEISFNFISKNSNRAIEFLSSFCPALLDNNYINVSFGSYSTNTTYPLYELTTTKLYAHYYFSFLSGQRVYILNNSFAGLNDDFRTTVIDTNILYFDLKNDAWAQYTSANKYRWAQLTSNSLNNTAENMIGVAQGNIKGKYAIKDILSNRRSYTPKRGNLKAKYQRAVDKINLDNDLDLAGGIASSGISAINDITNQYYTEKNLLATPSTLKQTGNANGAAGANGMTIFSSINIVDDYTACAYYYHLNGYLVKEYKAKFNANNAFNGLFDYINTRYYYNIIKMSQLTVHMEGYIESDNITDNISSRLLEGFRLWNVDNAISIGDFTYDNVEKDYLQRKE